MQILRRASMLMAATGLWLIVSCSHQGIKSPQLDASGHLNRLPFPIPATRDVDMLFVIDNSGSMAGGQTNARISFPALTASLRSGSGGLPNLHLGVTTTDLGTGTFQITYCEEVGGNAGDLVTGNCTNPTGAPYIIDVEPESCEISKEPDGTCSTHTCSQANCVHEPATTFVEDSATGCPRCRNYADESLEDVFSCIGNLGTMGCGFEQPLEAMYKALDNNWHNTGFIRANAYLAVVLLTDEDDCSASNPQLFDGDQTSIDGGLGPLTSYRCFEYGTTCDINDRTHVGIRQNCVPRDDAAALLHPISRYVQFMQALKDPMMLLVSAIAGPVTPSAWGGGHNVEVGLNGQDHPEPLYSCIAGSRNATPGIRIHSFVSAFNDEQDLDSWAYSSICSPDHTPIMSGIGDRITDVLERRCLPAPLKGCADVGVEFGSPRAAQSCAINAQCLAECSVTDVYYRGLPTESDHTVPPCLEVMPDGWVLANNTDRGRAYANGHPNERDANLPVAVCWHINYRESCTVSNYAELVISRRIDPPPRTYTNVDCQELPRDEQLCNDGSDNDEDCLVDGDDPDCL